MRGILLLSLACAPLAFAACVADGDGPIEAGAAKTDTGAAAAVVEQRVKAEPGPRAEPIVVDPAVVIAAAAPLADDEEGFALNAFPPMLPDTDAHTGAWMRDDCLLCHQEGLKGAPFVTHRDMSRLLLQANCRTCHVAADPDAGPLTNLAGEELMEFSVDAFPPTLPVDDDHSQGWLRSDCLQCHKWGLNGAQKVRHTGMSPLLLQANCRSCHVPGTSSEFADVPD